MGIPVSVSLVFLYAVQKKKHQTFFPSFFSRVVGMSGKETKSTTGKILGFQDFEGARVIFL